LFYNTFKISSQKVKAYQAYRSYANMGKALCLAPFKSLRFMPDGRMTVCCHNNAHALGTYPHNKPLDAWRGEKNLKLQKKLLHADLSLGCYVCYPAFKSKSYGSANPLYYEAYDANENFPVILDFKIDTRCNLSCVMCTEHSSSPVCDNSDLSANLDKNIYKDNFIEDIKPIIPYLKEARFSGGEPFLSKIYFRLWENIINVNPDCKIKVQTNGTILNDNIKELIEKGNFHINVSIDAASENLYSKIRRGGDLKNTLSNLKYFADYSKKRNIMPGITACAMQDNIYELPALLELANNNNARLWFSDVYFPFTNALWVLNSNTLARYIAFLSEQKFSISSEICRHNIKVYTDFVERLKYFWVQSERRSIIRTDVLERKLKRLFGTENDAMILEKIEKALLDLKNKQVINLVAEIQKHHNSYFVYTLFKNMSVEKLAENFKALVIEND